MTCNKDIPDPGCELRAYHKDGYRNHTGECFVDVEKVRQPPTWTKEDAEYFGKFGACFRCGATLRVGESYWLDYRSQMAEPGRVFHAECPKA